MITAAASSLLYGPPTTRTCSRLAMHRSWARSHPPEYAARLIDVASDRLGIVAEQLAMTEADRPGEVPDHEASFAPEGEGAICVSVAVLGDHGPEVGAHRVLEPYELLESPWVEALARAADK